MVEVLVLLACRGCHSPLGRAPLLVPGFPFRALQWGKMKGGEAGSVGTGMGYGEGREGGAAHEGATWRSTRIMIVYEMWAKVVLEDWMETI